MRLVIVNKALWLGHSDKSEYTKCWTGMKVVTIPAFNANYMYLVFDETTKQALAVDPALPEKMAAAVKERNLTLTTVLTTHKHRDHSAGNWQLCQLIRGLTVVGGEDDILAINKKVTNGDRLTVGQLSVECLFTPGHTTADICYYVTSSADATADPVVFTGDTLFIAGCGRFSTGKPHPQPIPGYRNGTPEDMHTSLNKVLAKLPDHTKVYCGHEYTVKNLRFALTIEPNNEDIQKKLLWAQDMRSRDVPTVPSTIGEEKKTNPFMRANELSVQKHVNRVDDVIQTMAELRELKNNFEPDGVF